MDKKEKAADQRLYRTYGIRLADYEEILQQQGGGCWVCGKPPKENKRLHVDHDHAFDRIKIKTKRTVLGWQAHVDVSPTYRIVVNWGKESSRKAVKAEARRMLRKLSIRGLLCWQDNTALQKYRDNPDRMEKAVQYLRNYQEKLKLINGQ